ncbi:MAG: glucose 1-dehydrogenase [Bacteroides sp.]|nr:glucose 1-dehydrogenase [Bacteroides sp.]
MYKDLKGKVAVVTGSSSGIGEAIARRFAKEGMKVVINYYQEDEKATQIVEEIKKEGGEAIAVHADVKEEKDMNNLLEKTIDAFGQLDVWVNNAGTQSPSSTHTMPLDVWQNVIDTNLTGTFLGSRNALNHFVKSHRKGIIINVSSIHEAVPFLCYAHYAASKGGIKQLTKTMAVEYAHLGIRINSIAPGAINTDINKDSMSDPEKLEHEGKNVPIQYVGEPKEVANVAAWLASEEASYVTGTTIYADGGLSLSKTQEKPDKPNK